MTIANLIIIALFVEALVQAIKPIWDVSANRFSIPEVIAMFVGIAVAIIGKINMLDGLITVASPVLVYALYVLSGIALGRGPSFVHDLWQKIRTFNVDEAVGAAENANVLINILYGLLNKKSEDKDENEENIVA